MIEKELVKVLKAIRHPEIESRTLGELGMLQSIQVTANNVLVTLALPLQQTPVKEKLIDLIEQTVRDLDSQLEVDVHTTAMTPEQRAMFMATAKGDQRATLRRNNVARVVAVDAVGTLPAG